MTRYDLSDDAVVVLVYLEHVKDKFDKGEIGRKQYEAMISVNSIKEYTNIQTIKEVEAALSGLNETGYLKKLGYKIIPSKADGLVGIG